jgi:hypothetical protein
VAVLVDREQILASRLSGHHLDQRLPAGSLLEAAGACGIQNTPPGSATVSLFARVEGLNLEDVERALVEDKRLVQVWAMRHSAWVVPSQDMAVFTLGLLPDDEESMRFFLYGLADHVEGSALEAVEAMASALHRELDGHVLTKREMGAALLPHAPDYLKPHLEPSLFTSFGATIARPVALRGLFVFAPRTGNEASFVRADQWLGAFPHADPASARAELVRRYLSFYGPATPEDFAAWAGISQAQAERWSALAGHEAPLERSFLPSGVRLLPPHDPYLGQRPRDQLVADADVRKRIWKPSGMPGTVLADGEIAAIWRQQKKGKRLALTIEPFAAVDREAVEAEAAALGAFLGLEPEVVWG